MFKKRQKKYNQKIARSYVWIVHLEMFLFYLLYFFSISLFKIYIHILLLLSGELMNAILKQTQPSVINYDELSLQLC